MIVVIFDEDLRVTEAPRIERATVAQPFPHRAHVNGRIITVTTKLGNGDGARVVKLSDVALDGPPAALP